MTPPIIPPRQRPMALRGRSDDTGAVTVFLVITVLGLMVMAGLVVDAGNRLRAISHADALAAEAARAAGQQINVPDAITGKPPTVDAVRAARAATQFLAGHGVESNLRLEPERRTLNVTVHTSVPTVFLALIGITSLDADGHASVALIPTTPGAAP